jgi:hypothetical protein
MKTRWMVLAGRLVLMVSILALTASGPTEAKALTFAGLVLAVDKAGGTIVIGDMGPLLSSGKSQVTRRTIQVTPSTEFVRVKRAAGIAPSGWDGDYVETRLAAWEAKPGDFAAVTSEGHRQGLQAVKITVVDTSEP